MATPNYKLKNDHAASIGHVRELYAKVIQEFVQKTSTGDIDMGTFKVKNLGSTTYDLNFVGALGDPERKNAVEKAYVDDYYVRKDGSQNLS